MREIFFPKDLDTVRTHRHAMADLGWHVLPSTGKVCSLPEWNSWPCTPEEIDSWPTMLPTGKKDGNGRAEKAPAVTTGIKLKDNMVAIDCDVDDPKLSQKIEDLTVEILGDAPLRASGGESWMMLYQCSDDIPIKVAKSVEVAIDDTKQQVEVYTGKHGGKFFAMWGPHTIVRKKVWEVKRDYEWFGPELTTPEALPTVEWKQVDKLMRKIHKLLTSGKYELVEKSKSTSIGVGDPVRVFDLEADLFDTNEGRLTYGEVARIAQTGQKITCSASCIDGIDHENTTRCMISVDHKGQLGIHDLSTGVTHYRPDAQITDPTDPDKVQRLGDALGALFPKETQEVSDRDAEVGGLEDALQEKIDLAIDTYYYNAMSGEYHRKHRGIRKGIKKQTLIEAWNKHIVPVYDEEKEKVTMVHPIKLCIQRGWFDQIEGIRFDPRYGDEFERDKEWFANEYEGLPELPYDKDDNEAMLFLTEFLVHLIPNDDERHWFIDWLADKYQNPHHRNCGVLFIAAGEQGAGRGTLFDILDRVFGYTITIKERTLLDPSFNGFMENNLLIFCDELGSMGYADRKKGYERLKAVVDPSHTSVTVDEKYVPMYKTRTFTSFCAATNNPNALVMDAEDRRFAIITNGPPLIEVPHLFEMVAKQGDDKPLNQRVAACMQHLLKHRLVTSVLSNAPHFEGREAMLSANDSELDDTMREIVEAAGPQRAWIRSDFIKAVKLAQTGSTTGQVKGLHQEVKGLVGKRGDRVGAKVLPKRMKVGTRTVDVVAKDARYFTSLSPDQRAQLVTGKDVDGDPLGNVTKLK